MVCPESLFAKGLPTNVLPCEGDEDIGGVGGVQLSSTVGKGSWHSPADAISPSLLPEEKGVRGSSWPPVALAIIETTIRRRDSLLT